MKAWWLNEYECWAGETLEEAIATAEAETGCPRTEILDEDVGECYEANPNTRVNLSDEDASHEEWLKGPFKTIGELLATMDKPGFVCGHDS